MSTQWSLAVLFPDIPSQKHLPQDFSATTLRFSRIRRASGRHWGLKAMPTAFARADGRIEPMVLEALRTQLELIRELSRRIEALEQQLEVYERSDERCRRLRAIPGVGPLTATAIVASVGDAREFRSGREFAAWLGVVPRQSGTGGRVRLLSISKRGNPYLRAMIIHCARAVAARQKVRPPWLVKLLQTKHWNGIGWLRKTDLRGGRGLRFCVGGTEIDGRDRSDRGEFNLDLLRSAKLVAKNRSSPADSIMASRYLFPAQIGRI
jgi:hypothetical protein